MALDKDIGVLKIEHLNADVNSKETRKPTFYSHLNNFRKLITVEPVAFLALFSMNISLITTQTLELQKACRVNLNLGDEICDSLLAQNQSNDFSHYERLVQEYYASHVFWKTILQTGLPCILLIFIGGWSDKTGRRKIVLLIPILGAALSALNNIINVIFFNQLPLQMLIFFNMFFVYGAGGYIVTVLGLLNYICSVTTAENRTHRLGIINLCTFVGIPVGTSISGILFRQYGYYAVYGTALLTDTINLLYITYRLSDPPRSEEQMKYDGQGFIRFIKNFFDLTTIKDTVKVIFKKTSNSRTLRLCIMLAVAIIIYGPTYGEASILFMATRYRFNWDEVRYSIFQAYSYIATALGTIIAITLFSKYLKLHDSVMGITSVVSRIGAALLFCFAPNERIFFIGPTIDMFNATALLAVKSLATKFLETTEIGKFNALMSLIENLTPLIYIPIFTKVYTMTMDSYPGAVFLLGGMMLSPSLPVFIWLLYTHRREVKK